MKNLIKIYFIFWIVALVIFNVMAFATTSGADNADSLFWISYISITVIFIGQFVCSCAALKFNSLKKAFYNIPAISVNYISLALILVIGSLCIAISFISSWIGIVICGIVLLINIFIVIKVKLTVGIVVEIDERIEKATFFVKNLADEAEILITRAKNDKMKETTKKVYEAIRYSDPMSNKELASIEAQIADKFRLFSDEVRNNEDGSITIADELIILIEDRNKRCKLLKSRI